MSNITRDFSDELLSRLNQGAPFLQVVMGPRQVGKTTGVLALQEKWKGRFFYASADSPSPPNHEWIREQWLAARAHGENALLALDEIQKITGWSEIIKQLFDEERRRKDRLSVVLLGSASWGVQKGLSESLTGRFELLRVSHWSLNECQKAFGWKLDQFLKFGGYPAPAILVDEPERWQQFIRDSILEPMLSRDILALRAVSKPALLRQTLELALRHPAQEISLQKILGQLQDSGNSTTIRGYLELLEAGFVIKTLTKFSTRPLSTKSSSPKIIPLCGALMHAFENPSRIDTDTAWKGRVFEAVIGATLARCFPKVSYWRDGRYEVDFVVEDDSRLFAIEVKSSSEGRLTGLTEFKKRFKNTISIVLNYESGEKFLAAEDPAEVIRSSLV